MSTNLNISPPSVKPPMFPSFTKTSHHESYPSISPDRPDLTAAGKVVLITGAGSGIGRATAVAFAQARAKTVILCGRRIKPLEETKSQIETLGLDAEVLVQVLDVSSENNVDTVFGTVHSHTGAIDIVINAAGHLSEPASLRDTSLGNFWTSFEVNVKGAFLVSRAFLRLSAKDSNSSGNQRVLILLSSLLGHLPASEVTTAPAPYGISKLAEAKLAEYIVTENPGVLRVYAIQHGVVETEMSDRSIAMAPEGTREAITWDDVELSAHFMVWLASSRGKAVPSGRFLWINWDVDELGARSTEMKDDPYLLSMVMGGWPFDGKVRG